jgi:RHS repeat-associated protein
MRTLFPSQGDFCATAPEVDKRTLQDLRYTYDPAGNITHIQDDAQQTIYFRNQRVEPSNDYVYDAVYRLLSAKGREHLGQTGGQRNPPTASDAFNQFHTHLDHPGDGDALGTYIEEYEYDAVGNFQTMHHRVSDPAHPGWTRSYVYNEPSLLEPAKQSNRLSSTQIGGGALEEYTYDEHGNMTAMPHLPTLRWDCEDQLAQVDLQGGGTAYYVYDAGGQRVRKMVERNGATVEERIYLGGYEVYRKRQGGVLQLERQTLHIMDDKQRIALVETRTQGNDGSLPQMIRLQFGNHLGSASLELDDHAQIISYEEYFPYGSTSYQAVRNQTETPKRYRYTGMERDEESGLSYHSARYYVPWLGRWSSCDPMLGNLIIEVSSSLYAALLLNPIRWVDIDGKQPDSPYSPSFFERLARSKVGQAVVLVIGLIRRDPDTGKLAPKAPVPSEVRKSLGRVDELLYADPCGNQMNKSHKGMAEFLIARGNTSKLFECIEEPCDFLP